MRIWKLLLAVAILAPALVVAANPAQAQGGPVTPDLCTTVHNDGDTQANLTVTAAANDGAVDYQVVRNLTAAGTFQQVTIITAPLNKIVTLENLWVRSRNAQGNSPWVSCEVFERVSFIDPVPPADYRRPSANVAHGLDGNGSITVGNDNNNEYGIFAGEDQNIVVDDASNAPQLAAANGDKLAWRVRFRVSQTDLNFLQNQGNNGVSNVSWNLMQRGLASDPGGQWKMSLVSSNNSDKVSVSCTVSDFAGSADNIETTSSVNISNLNIVGGFTEWISATCLMDNTGTTGPGGNADGLQVVVEGQANPEVIDGDFGELLPSFTGDCSFNGITLNPPLFPGGIGNVVTLGNKPACIGPNTSDDAFRGHVDFGEIWELSPIVSPPTNTVYSCGGVNGNAAAFAAAGYTLTVGTNSADVINVSAANTRQAVVALGGDDTVIGGSADDLICGGDGNDTLNGANGADSIFGDDGNDQIFGLNGNDFLRGGPGSDTVVGGAGDETINGDSGADELVGGAGNDVINGGAGDDRLFGLDNDDDLRGGSDDDFVVGGNGADTVRGDAGDDVVNGGPGDDTVNGGNGDDVVFGFSGNDQVLGQGGNDQVFGQTGNDVVDGGLGNDQVFGNQGNDFLNDPAGTNVMNGGADDDQIVGGTGNDQIFGDGNLAQAGDDTLTGNGGSDLLNGFAGQDSINSQDGGIADTVNGGPGVDACTTDVVDTVFNCP